MSFRSLLNQPVTIVHPASSPTGFDFGAAAGRVVTVGRLDQSGSTEEETGWPTSSPDTAVTNWTLFLGPAEVVGMADRVEQGARIFEVVGDPNQVFGRRGVHHLEVQLRSVVVGASGGLVSLAAQIVPPPAA